MILSASLLLSLVSPAHAAHGDPPSTTVVVYQPRVRYQDASGQAPVVVVTTTDTSVASVELSGDLGDAALDVFEDERDGTVEMDVSGGDGTLAVSLYGDDGSLLTVLGGDLVIHDSVKLGVATPADQTPFTLAPKTAESANIVGFGQVVDRRGDGQVALVALRLVGTGVSKVAKAVVDYTPATGKLATSEGTAAWSFSGASWAGELGVDAFDTATIKVTTRDARGKKLEADELEVVPTWDDGGFGIPAIAIDEDPYTTVALTPPPGRGWTVDSFFDITYRAAACCSSQTVDSFFDITYRIASAGWYGGDDLPELAVVTLDGGDEWEVPVESYQSSADENMGEPFIDGEAATFTTDSGEAFSITIGGDAACGEAVCAQVRAVVDGTWDLLLTTYAADAGDLPETVSGEICAGDEKSGETCHTVFSDLTDEEVSVYWGVAANLGDDPTGLDLTGNVKLEGAANTKGKRKTLAKGRFAARFGTSLDGGPALLPIDRDKDIDSRGDLFVDAGVLGSEMDGAGKAVAVAPTCLSQAAPAAESGASASIGLPTSCRPGRRLGF